MHALLKIDRVKNFHAVIILHQGMSNFINYCTLRKRFVNTENDNSLKNDCFNDELGLEIAGNHFLTY